MTKPIDLGTYNTLVFDCDGVILDSNTLKRDAFYDATKQYGTKFADELVRYHTENGGISRYEKFKYFFERILHIEFDQHKYDEVLDMYANYVKSYLLKCEICEGLDLLRRQTPHANWLIVSGGDQNEIRDVFMKRSIAHFFDGGVFGSPDNKNDILKREIKRNNIKRNALFFGDSKYDFTASNECGVDFVFVSEWTEVRDWQSWVNRLELPVIKRVKDLCN